MRLYEFEGHRIFAKAGIESPFFVLCSSLEEIREARKRLKFPMVAKIQVLSGKRGRRGGVEVIKTEKKLIAFCREKFGSEFNNEEVRFISLCEYLEIEEEHYASITYDTLTKQPFLMYCASGGVDIEDIERNDKQAIIRYLIDPIKGPKEKDLKKIVGGSMQLADFLMRLWDAFWRYDLRLAEINPIAKTKDGFLAVDAKVILDGNGLGRQKGLDVLPKGAASAIPTKREIEAKKIDAEDYRGSAGSTFIEFDGDIAILASGGGASLMIMDSVAAEGGKFANYTEYSGNPPREKVEKLTRITLQKEGISGCLVAGAVANFTDIFETLSGFCEGLKAVKPKPGYPIVIRRGGPRQKEAYEMIASFAKKEGFDIHLFGPETPISLACREMVILSKEYKSKIK